MKQYRWLAALLGLLPLLGGCAAIWTEIPPIEALAQVETVGLDQTPDGTALSICASSPYLRETQTASSIRLAMDALQQQTGQAALFYAHTKFLLLGARSDLPAALDYVARSSDMRLRTPVVVLKNAQAADAVALGGDETDVTAMLTAMQADADRRGACKFFSAGEVLRGLSESGCALAAAAELHDGALREAGYAVLTGGTIAGYLAPEAAMAAGLLLNLGTLGDVALERGVTVTLERSRCRLRNGCAEITVKAALTENSGGLPMTASARSEIERALADTLLRRVQTAIRQCMRMDADLFDFGEGAANVRIRVSLARTLDLLDPIPLAGEGT